MVDLPEGPDYEPTDAVPVVTPLMRLLLRGLDKATIVDVALTIRKIAEASSASCVKHLLKDADTWSDAIHILHSAPKMLHRAVVLHTVAMQSRLSPSDPHHIPPDIYHCDGPGTYVATITVSGRNGMWLTGKELRRLVDLIERYLDAARSSEMLGDGVAPTTRRTIDMARFAKDIDGIYGQAQYPRTAMIRRPRTRTKVESLVAGLKGLWRAAKDNIPIASPPCYVGCSRQAIRSCADNHKPDAGWHSRKGNHAWWLVLSCMKFMGLHPHVIVVPYLRTWAVGQLPASETIGTILADSFIERRGYNIWIPGSTSDLRDRAWWRDREAALLWRPWLIDQMKESVATLEARIEMIQYLDSMNVWDIHEAVRQRVAQMQDVSDGAGAELERLVAARELDRRAVADALRDWRRQFETAMAISNLAGRLEQMAVDVPDEAGAVDDEWEDEDGEYGDSQ